MKHNKRLGLMSWAIIAGILSCSIAFSSSLLAEILYFHPVISFLVTLALTTFLTYTYSFKKIAIIKDYQKVLSVATAPTKLIIILGTAILLSIGSVLLLDGISIIASNHLFATGVVIFATPFLKRVLSITKKKQGFSFVKEIILTIFTSFVQLYRTISNPESSGEKSKPKEKTTACPINLEEEAELVEQELSNISDDALKEEFSC